MSAVCVFIALHVCHLSVAFHVRDIVSSLERTSRDRTYTFAAIQLSEDMIENIRNIFMYRTECFEFIIE